MADKQADDTSRSGAPALWQCLAAEFIGTMLLTFVAVGTDVMSSVGSIIALAGLAFSPVSGASMNPARSLGPMIVANDFTLAPVYVFAPLAGATGAVGAAWMLLGRASSQSAESARGGRA